MREVLVQREKVGRGFSVGAVHDLRVALRRCLSILESLMEIDPHPDWEKMQSEGKKLFKRFGRVRDVQVCRRWLKKLSPARDPLGNNLQKLLSEREPDLRKKVQKGLSHLDADQWITWAETLSERAHRWPPDSQIYEYLALQRWSEAYLLHTEAVRRRSMVAYHELRIGVKRFRYVVENFLPSRHETWGRDLKKIQDLLGEVHDLDNLWQTLLATSRSFNEKVQARWRARIDDERQSRLKLYRQMMRKKQSLWLLWRASLPDDKELLSLGLLKLKIWASALDPDNQHAAHVSKLAVEIFDGLARAGLPAPFGDPDARRFLVAASLVQDVGKVDGQKGHHHSSYEKIAGLHRPLGWSQDDMEMVALIARYHRGAVPRSDHRGYKALPALKRQQVRSLSAVLRLANALDCDHKSRVTEARVTPGTGTHILWAYGLDRSKPAYFRAIAEKGVLESACGISLVVQPAKTTRPTDAKSLASVE